MVLVIDAFPAILLRTPFEAFESVVYSVANLRAMSPASFGSDDESWNPTMALSDKHEKGV